MFYSKSTGGFYSREVHNDNIPSDAVEIADDAYHAFLINQSEGMTISANADGYPILISPAPSPLFVPSINAAQIRLQLTAIGLRDAVEAAVSAGSQDLKDKWSYSPRFVVTDPDIQAMATAMGVTSAQLDQLFIDAAQR